MERLDRLDVEAARRLAQPEFRWLAPPSALKVERAVRRRILPLAGGARAASVVAAALESPPCVGCHRTACLSLGYCHEPSGWTARTTNGHGSTSCEFRDGLFASVREFEHRRRGRGVRLRRHSRRGAVQSAGGHEPGQRERRGVVARDAGPRRRRAHRQLRGSVRVRRSASTERRPDRRPGRECGRRSSGSSSSTPVSRAHALAVRGERLALAFEPLVGRRRERDDRILHVFEIGEDGRTIYDGRFDEDDFDGAYRELERRYYAGEGAAFAVKRPAITRSIEAMIASTSRRHDRLVAPDVPLAGTDLQRCRSRTAPSMTCVPLADRARAAGRLVA